MCSNAGCQQGCSGAGMSSFPRCPLWAALALSLSCTPLEQAKCFARTAPKTPPQAHTLSYICAQTHMLGDVEPEVWVGSAPLGHLGLCCGPILCFRSSFRWEPVQERPTRILKSLLPLSCKCFMWFQLI